MYTKYTGVILKKYPLGEADELLTIYTKQLGKLRAKARGVRRIQSRLMGNLQTLNEIEFETAQAVQGFNRKSSLPVIISTRTRMINDYLRQDLKKFAYALMGIETLYRITPDEEQNLGLYEALVSFLQALGNSHDENLEVRRFQLKLLEGSGYGIQFPTEPINLSSAPIGDGQTTRKEKSSSPIHRLTPALERVIDQFLESVLEREIKSKRFLKSII